MLLKLRPFSGRVTPNVIQPPRRVHNGEADRRRPALVVVWSVSPLRRRVRELWVDLGLGLGLYLRRLRLLGRDRDRSGGPRWSGRTQIHIPAGLRGSVVLGGDGVWRWGDYAWLLEIGSGGWRVSFAAGTVFCNWGNKTKLILHFLTERQIFNYFPFLQIKIWSTLKVQYKKNWNFIQKLALKVSENLFWFFLWYSRAVVKF